MRNTLKLLRKYEKQPYMFSRISDEIILPKNIEEGKNVIAVTSVGPKEGKSFTSLLYAVQEAERGDGPILLIDAGSRSKRALTPVLGRLDAPGYEKCIGEKFDSEELVFSTRFENLHFMPGSIKSLIGPSRTGIKAFHDTITALEKEYSTIILDCESLSSGPFIYEQLKAVTGAIICLEYGLFSSVKVQHYVEKLQSQGIEVLGGVLNKRKYPIPMIIHRLL